MDSAYEGLLNDQECLKTKLEQKK